MTGTVEVIMTLFSMIIKEPGGQLNRGAPASRLRGNSPHLLCSLAAHLRAETYKAVLCIFPLKEKIRIASCNTQIGRISKSC